MCHAINPMQPSAVGESIAPQTERRIAERWVKWTPWAAMESKQMIDPVAQFHELHIRHRRRVLACLRGGLQWQTITRRDLDDPRRAGLEFDRMLADALRRRGAHLGVGKGLSRAEYEGKSRRATGRSRRTPR